jgi:hypothetical protein
MFGKAVLLTFTTASFNEKLLLSNGLNISPIRAKEQGSSNRSLREAVNSIDNEKDLSNFISSFAGKVPPKATEIRYQRNPVSTSNIR